MKIWNDLGEKKADGLLARHVRQAGRLADDERAQGVIIGIYIDGNQQCVRLNRTIKINTKTAARLACSILNDILRDELPRISRHIEDEMAASAERAKAGKKWRFWKLWK